MATEEKAWEQEDRALEDAVYADECGAWNDEAGAADGLFDERRVDAVAVSALQNPVGGYAGRWYPVIGDGFVSPDHVIAGGHGRGQKKCVSLPPVSARRSSKGGDMFTEDGGANECVAGERAINGSAGVMAVEFEEASADDPVRRGLHEVGHDGAGDDIGVVFRPGRAGVSSSPVGRDGFHHRRRRERSRPSSGTSATERLRAKGMPRRGSMAQRSGKSVSRRRSALNASRFWSASLGDDDQLNACRVCGEGEGGEALDQAA